MKKLKPELKTTEELLNKFLEDCKKEDISADIIVIFTKNGYSTELKALKSETLKLFNVKSLKALVQ